MPFSIMHPLRQSCAWFKLSVEDHHQPVVYNLLHLLILTYSWVDISQREMAQTRNCVFILAPLPHSQGRVCNDRAAGIAGDSRWPDSHSLVLPIYKELQQHLCSPGSCFCPHQPPQPNLIPGLFHPFFRRQGMNKGIDSIWSMAGLGTRASRSGTRCLGLASWMSHFVSRHFLQCLPAGARGFALLCPSWAQTLAVYKTPASKHAEAPKRPKPPFHRCHLPTRSMALVALSSIRTQ